MLISNNTYNNYVGNNRSNSTFVKESSSFQPAAQQDLVDIGNSVNDQNRFIDLGPVLTVLGGGAGVIAGGVGGTIAYAFGAPGWVIPVAAVGCGILGGVIGHVNEN